MLASAVANVPATTTSLPIEMFLSTLVLRRRSMSSRERSARILPPHPQHTSPAPRTAAHFGGVPCAPAPSGRTRGCSCRTLYNFAAGWGVERRTSRVPDRMSWPFASRREARRLPGVAWHPWTAAHPHTFVFFCSVPRRGTRRSGAKARAPLRGAKTKEAERGRGLLSRGAKPPLATLARPKGAKRGGARPE